MIEDMKAKAQKFEEFMMQNMSKTKHSINNTIKTSKSTETDGDWKKSVRNIGVGTDGKINLEELENIHEKHQVILIIILAIFNYKFNIYIYNYNYFSLRMKFSNVSGKSAKSCHCYLQKK